MTFDCSDYFTLRFIYTSTLIANFREKVNWHNRVPHGPIGPFSVLRCDAERDKYESRVI